MTYRHAWIAVLVVGLLAAAGTVHAQAMGRVSGKVLDHEGNPIAGVKIIITTPQLASFNVEKKTNKRGKFVMGHNDATMTFEYRFEKEGYQTLVERVKPQPGGVINLEFVMMPPEAAAAAAAAAASAEGGGGLAGGDRAVMAYNEGVQAQEAGDLMLAKKRYLEASEIDPGLAAPYTALAGLAVDAGNLAEAAELTEKALELDPSDYRALHIRYDAYRKSGDTAKAEEAAAALREAGGAESAAKRIFNEGAVAYNEGDLAAAKAKFLEVVRLDPSLTQAYGVLAGIYLREGNPQQAGEMAAEVLAREPDNANALKIRYDTARVTGDEAAVQETLAKLAEVDPQWAATGLLDHAVELFNANKLDEAAVALEGVLEADPDNPKAHYWLGLCQFNSGNTEDAKVHLSRFIELAPDDPDAAVAREMLQYAN
jgi:tetratricopeptide (TPR) repeat protein